MIPRTDDFQQRRAGQAAGGLPGRRPISIANDSIYLRHGAQGGDEFRP